MELSKPPLAPHQSIETYVDAWYTPLTRVTIVSVVLSLAVMVIFTIVGFQLGTRYVSDGAGYEVTHNATMSVEEPIIDHQLSALPPPRTMQGEIDFSALERPLSYAEALWLIRRDGTESLNRVIVTDRKNNQVRFVDPGFYYPTLSGYVLRNSGIYYAPYTEDGVVEEAQKIIANPNDFRVYQYGVAHGDNQLFFAGQLVASTSFVANNVYGVYVTETSIYMLVNVGKNASLVRVFDDVNGQRVRAFEELGGVYVPVADGGFRQQWLTDERYFYCLSRSAHDPQLRLTMPVDVIFEPRQHQAPSNQLRGDDWYTQGASEIKGETILSEVATGKRYTPECRER